MAKFEIPDGLKSSSDFIDGFLAALHSLHAEIGKLMQAAQLSRTKQLRIVVPNSAKRFQVKKRESPADYLEGYLAALRILKEDFGKLVEAGETAQKLNQKMQEGASND
jgi:hypothetical protein